MSTPPRVRRSPKEARRLILETAGKRLAELGNKGLNIKDTAADSGINHGTLLHHFGSAEGMRNALLVKLSEEHINEMSIILTSGAPPVQRFMALFRLMSQTGQTKLLA
jgi:AcrR family transcriptional regulator